MTNLDTVLRAHQSDRPLEASPINPDWILAGEPVARSIGHGQGGSYETAVWDCTAGTFRWHYDLAETICILEGEATVTGPDGVTQRLRAGDVAIFPAGAWFHWHIPHYVRKFAILNRNVHVPFPALLREVMRRLGHRIASLVRPRRPRVLPAE